MTNDELNNLLKFATTKKQIKTIEAVIECGGYSQAARFLDVKRQTVQTAIKQVKKKAARQGYSPEHDMKHSVPDGFHLKGTSTLYDQDGNQKMQWVKSNIDQKRQFELMQEAIKALCEDLPKEAPVTPPNLLNNDLISKYVVTDYHIGMMAWGEETGADWDLKIAEELLVSWFKAAIELTPNSKVAILAQLGDFLHWDGLEAVTPTSRHVLDADSRFQKLVRVAVRVLRRVIGMLLEKHEAVHVICAEGNHDIASSIWLRECLAVMYEDEPRITIDQNPDPYYCYTFGKNCFFFHHGHKKKMAAIDSVFVSKYKQEFGSSEFVYADLGHLHHERVLESNLMVLEQHRTLAAPDSHASRGGWMSGRSSKVVTYHKDYGKVVEHTISPQLIAA